MSMPDKMSSNDDAEDDVIITFDSHDHPHSQQVPLGVSNHNIPKREPTEFQDIDSLYEISETPYKDLLPWQEAEYIHSLLPFLLLNNIYTSLMDNYYNPNRKAKVLEDYIQISVEEGYEIQPEVFEALFVLQESKKRSHKSQDKLPKKQKLDNHNNFSLPSTSQSHLHEAVSLTENYQEKKSPPVCLKEDVSCLNEDRKRAWLLEKAEFLMALNASYDYKYILSKISHCHTDSDIEIVAAELLEQDQPQNYNQPVSDIVPSISNSLSVVNDPSVNMSGSLNTSLAFNNQGNYMAQSGSAFVPYASTLSYHPPANPVMAYNQASPFILASNFIDPVPSSSGYLPPIKASTGNLINPLEPVPSTSGYLPPKEATSTGNFIKPFKPVPLTSQESQKDFSNSSSVQQSPLDPSDSVASASTQRNVDDIEDVTQMYFQKLSEMFLDADPDYLQERAASAAGGARNFEEVVTELVEKRSYPKMDEYLKRQQRLDMRKKFIDGMSMEEFTTYFEHSDNVLYDIKKIVSDVYRKNARIQLLNDFPRHLAATVDQKLRVNNYHYLPTYSALKVLPQTRKGMRAVTHLPPGDLEDNLLKEICYAKMEHKILQHKNEQKRQREAMIEEMKGKGALQECQCCFEDDILPSEMSGCDADLIVHLYCNECVRRQVEEQIGQGRTDFKCIEVECDQMYSLNTLQKVLKPAVFSKLLTRKQVEEIAAAHIEDLESCPFCNFATIMPNKEDKVFKCLNPDCLKDSCRLCKELNHIPLRCDEVEKKNETTARTFIENKMTEAMIRECYRCKRRFIKEEGCNKMVCSCGAVMCYLCKAPIKGYDHFNGEKHRRPGDNRCPLWTNSITLHSEEVKKGAKEAKENLDPNIELKSDPTKTLQ